MKEELLKFLNQYDDILYHVENDQIIFFDYDFVINIVLLDNWNEKKKQKKSMINLSKEWEAKKMFCIHIFEDDWNNPTKKEIIKSRLLNKFGKSQKIWARKCKIKEIDPTTAMSFCNENHIQGGVGSRYKLGLYHNDELVAVLSVGLFRVALGNKIHTEGMYELLRFCNKRNTTVIGAASKLFNYFIKTYNPKSVASFSDKCWSTGEVYKTLGFEYQHTSEPNYYYIQEGIRKHRFNFRKDRLIKLGYGTSSDTEVSMCHRANLFRIWDCGNDRLIYNNHKYIEPKISIGEELNKTK